jgi:tetratricopeptide (TPR) repeat protein
MFGRRSKKLPATVATGLSLLQGGDRDGALRAFAEASHTGDPDVLRALGAAYQQAGEDGYAEHCLRLAAQGGSRDALNDLGVLLKKQNRTEEAEQAFRQASDLGCANASNNLGNIWEMRGDLQAAAWYWHRAAEGGVPRAMVSLGIYLAGSGQQPDARIFYDRARAVLPQAPEIRDQLDLLGNMLSGSASRGQNDPFGPTVGRIAAGPPATGGPATGGVADGDFRTGGIPDSDSLTRTDTALTTKRAVPGDEPTPLTTKRPMPAEESSASQSAPGQSAADPSWAGQSWASQPASGGYAPTMISRSMPELSGIGDSVSGGTGGTDEIDTATVRNPRFRPREETPSAPEVTDGEFHDAPPAAEVGPPAPWDLKKGAVEAADTSAAGGPEPALAESAAGEVSAPEVTSAPDAAVAEEAPTGATPFDPTIVRPTGPWPSGPLPGGPLPSGTWATESRRELRGEEPPTAYHRRLPTDFTEAPGGDEPAAPAAEPAGVAAAFDLSDNLRTVEKLRASYMESRNATTLRLALEISKVGVESAPADDPTAQALALSLRCTLLRLAYERDRNEAELGEAIAAGRLAKSLFKLTDAGFPRALNSLATALQAEYSRAQDPAILTEALALYREAVRALPEGHPELPAMFTNIANVLLTQGLSERNPDLLDEAIHSAREAVGMSDPGDAAYPTRQASLGMALVAHYANSSGAATDLDEAERLFNAALATLPPNHALRPQVQSYLAGVSALRFA